jgi:hypothetical protein
MKDNHRIHSFSTGAKSPRARTPKEKLEMSEKVHPMPNRAETKFPLLVECFEFAQDSVGLFPMLKNWNQGKIKALLDEIDHADKSSEEAYGELAVRAEYFLSKSNSKALDHARLEVSLILSEIAAVALFFTDRKDAHA